MVPTSTIYCDTCGAPNRIQARFCTACGRLLPTSQPGANQTVTGLLVPNHQLKLRYRVVQQVGQGGFGAVYKAEDTQFGNRVVAIKEMSQSGLNTQEIAEATEAFKHEALLLAGLSHPNLPHIYEQFYDVGRWYLVMDFIDGETLEARLLNKGGKLPVGEVLEVGIQLSQVLNYLHNRTPPIIFRDLKPANVMMTSTGQVYLIDFGIARLFKPGQAKDTTAFGSAGYAPPEQYGKTQTTPRADIYSLGATMHQLITGIDPTDKPFDFAPLHLPANPAFDRLNSLILQMVSMDINKRPPNMQVVHLDLVDIAALVKSQGQSAGAATPVAAHSLQYGSSAVAAPQAPAIQTSGNVSTIGNAVKPLAPLFPNPHGLPACVCAGHTSRVTSVAWSPDSQKIASASYDKTVQIWEASTGKLLLSYRNHSDQIFDVAWSPNGRYVASAGHDQTVQVWDPITGKPVNNYRGHNGRITSISWSPDSQKIASASDDMTVQVWEAATGRSLPPYRGHADCLLAVAWSPDGRHIASGGKDKMIQIWDPNRESRLLALISPFRRQVTLSGHTNRINALAYAPGGRRIASASSDKTIRTWDTATGASLFTYSNRSSGINTVSWSPDGKRLVSGGNDKLVQVWDAQVGGHTFTYNQHSGFVTCVAWSPDGRFIASGSVDRTVQIWHAP